MPVAAAIARTSSCTGLPSVTPQRASGWPMRAASCSVSVVSSPASPGATSFGPPEKPAKKCGSTKPVVMRTSASTHSLFSHTGTSAPKRPIQVSERVVARVVVDDAHRREHLVAEHRAQLVVGVAAVRAGRDEDDDVLEPHEPLELLEQRRDDDLARLRARAVADADRDRLRRPRTTSRSGGPATGLAQRLEHGRALVRRRRRVQRLDDGRAVVRAGRRSSPSLP